jgi:actin-like protein 6B
MAELFFEQENVPAWYTACSGVLSAFASGKGTALVVDLGREGVVVTPVIEGYVLRSGTKRQPSGMGLIHAQSKAFLRAPAEPVRPFALGLTPFQLIKDRTPVSAGVAPRFNLRQERVAGTTDSWRDWAECRVVESFREATGAVFETKYEDRCVSPPYGRACLAG